VARLPDHDPDVINGYHEEDMNVWEAAGNLVAQARQLPSCVDHRPLVDDVLGARWLAMTARRVDQKDA
jgi:hypothetical protein